jgi:hypothetical protein
MGVHPEVSEVELHLQLFQEIERERDDCLNPENSSSVRKVTHPSTIPAQIRKLTYGPTCSYWRQSSSMMRIISS